LRTLQEEHRRKPHQGRRGQDDIVQKRKKTGKKRQIQTSRFRPASGRPRQLCALLDEIRERGLAAGRHASTFAALARALGCGAKKPIWPHDLYPGLLALDHWQAPIFFGRTAETRELLRRLTTDQGKHFLLVTGASGSGKSSLVRAGVWAALAKGEAPNLPASANWLITAMFPSEQGGDPFCALTNSLKQHPRLGWLYPGEEAEKLKSDPAAFADLLGRVLAGQSDTAEWLLILDQMEELFTPACAALRNPSWTCCSRPASCPASASSPPCARIS